MIESPTTPAAQRYFLTGSTTNRGPKPRIQWIVNDETGCWEWQCGKQRGYPRTSIGKHGAWAHRVVYLRHIGPIPDGWDLHHTCENPGCVNPTHLEPVDKVTHLRHHWRTRGPLSQEQIAEIRRLGLDPSLRQQDIADRFGIPRTTVSSLLTGQSWSDGERVTPIGRTCPYCGIGVEGRRNRKFCTPQHRGLFNAAKQRAA